ncbi:hypothetical protein OK414_29425 [Priestia sp. JV24]|uniref:hypothetical protein n=1 Tax=Priestia TaxID=2800373 RepID=UPI0021D663BB|nr:MULTISPECIES: hypothetical protein [Priestia]MCU7712991.1 hypothetical protein [Priestia megaterium]MCW1049176.1 hypothetical protein [Priestia sp. JV24]
MNVLTKENMAMRAKELFSKGIKITPDLLRKEEVETELVIQLEESLKSQDSKETLNRFINANSDYIRSSEKYHFVQGFLAAKGLEEELLNFTKESEFPQKKTVCLDKIKEAITAVMTRMDLS